MISGSLLLKSLGINIKVYKLITMTETCLPPADDNIRLSAGLFISEPAVRGAAALFVVFFIQVVY